MVLGFLLFGFGWALVWQAYGKVKNNSVLKMPLWFSTPSASGLLILLTILGGISHLIMSIVSFSWLGILYWFLLIIIFQFISSVFFPNTKTQNPAPPFFLGVIIMLVGLIIYL